MRTYRQDKARVDRFESQIKGILGQYFIKTAPQREDQEEATDMLILTLPVMRGGALRIACRIRQHFYWQRENYRQQFTVRSHRDSGARTEHAKILEGWGDYMLYGFADERDAAVLRAVLLDLHAFRSFEYATKKAGGNIPNGDGTYFHAYRYDAFPADLVVYQWPEPWIVKPKGGELVFSDGKWQRLYKGGQLDGMGA